MQKENISYNAFTAISAAGKSSASAEAPLHLISSINPFTSPTYVTSDAPFYTSLFHKSSSDSPSETASFDDGDTDGQVHEGSCILEYQQLYNRYTLCLAQLNDSIEEVDALRRENESLRLTNADLSRRLVFLFSRDRLFSDFNGLNVAPHSAAAPRAAHLTTTHPLTEHNRGEPRSTERVLSLPKSISVRSSGYPKMTRPGHGTTGHKAVSQGAAESERVYVPMSKKEKEALEFDAYDQGMFKTELCNKWQETGACPYGENCQFAHGINELRPVIRHPRYKTEVCRMVMAGEICPYGHRCHFRHTLTEKERLMAVQPRR
ncbi:hypothetical protein CDL12_15637 [Handroanthus impetiginosus]|uniref:C3H1-type domain-containing protein n=1 Tax=Handroanthus impetiginosus TaxID=429701 RepID=A0A2G9H2J8_9LAMI|nr:hypothetical protein CDL12_15637 [Handroanthus impetiginosus]